MLILNMKTLIAVLLLTGCGVQVSKERGLTVVCPTLFPYSAEEQAKLADELEAMPKDAVAPRMMIDYAKVRKQIRVCGGVS
jgi:hypothetical protein